MFLINTGTIWTIIAFVVFFAAIAIIVIAIINNKSKYYPNLKITVDITSKKNMSNNEAFDYYVINYGKFALVNHLKTIQKWKKEKIQKANNNAKKIAKLEQKWEENKYKAFSFEFYRTKTRYAQRNYQRYSYKVKEVSNSFIASDTAVISRIEFLESHGYYVTYDQFTREDQRKSLTKDLREMIKRRDNYTCQICGKYMPDEVGLHIDHIIPIARGGKSVPSNLRVLCSKCNGRKGDKTDSETMREIKL